LKLSDAALITKYSQERQIILYSRGSDRNTHKQVLKWLAGTSREMRRKRAFWFGIEEKQSRTLAGVISLREIDPRIKSAKLGFWIGKEYRRRGYSLQAVQLILGFAFKRLKLYRVYAAAHETNRASAKLLEKAGFQLEGRSRMAEFVGRKRCDVLWYGILKRELTLPA